MLRMQNQHMCKNQQTKLRNWQFKQGETKREPEVGEKYPAAPKVSCKRFNHTHPGGCNMHEINTLGVKQMQMVAWKSKGNTLFARVKKRVGGCLPAGCRRCETGYVL